MDDIDTLAERAESEIGEAWQQCESEAYGSTLRSRLWEVFRTWVDHPQFDKDFNSLQAVVLNELEFTLADENLRLEGWALITELAKRWYREDNATMKEALRIASFEIAAEPPEYPPTLELLFALAPDPETRWAVFAAYENCPWRLRPHAKKYSSGSISDADCDDWLCSQGLYHDEI